LSIISGGSGKDKQIHLTYKTVYCNYTHRAVFE